MSRTVAICICTYQRPHIADTLRSLAALQLRDDVTISAIVADNDKYPSAEAAVFDVAQGLHFPVHYVHAPSGNISIARNACLDASEAAFLAFIDDDETVTPGWLAELLETADASGADVVLGPVRARYDDTAPAWMRKGDFHSTFPVFVNGVIETGYSCNVLMRSDAPSVRGRRFDLGRGKTGGEDTAFFTDVRRSGGKIEYASQAWVEEPVPPGRATFGWLARRRFRVGQTHGRLMANADDGRGAALKDLFRAGSKVAYCAGMAVAAMALPVSRNRSVLRGIMHAGVVSGRLGAKELELY